MDRTTTGTKVLPVTMLIVSDYEPGAKTWHDERLAVQHYVSDPIAVPEKILVLVTQDDLEQAPTPPEWADLPVPVEVVSAPASTSAQLMNAGAARAAHDVYALVEADSLGSPGWLAQMYEYFTDHPELATLTCRTTYPHVERDRFARVNAVLDRDYVIMDGSGHIPPNAGLHRRSMVGDTPFTEDLTTSFIANHLRTDALLAEGRLLGVHPSAIHVHNFDGRRFVADLRRHKGFQLWRMAAHGRPDDWPVRGRARRLASVIGRSLRQDLRTLKVVGPRRLRGLDWIVAALLVADVRRYELQGALDAENGLDLPRATAFR